VKDNALEREGTENDRERDRERVIEGGAGEKSPALMSTSLKLRVIPVRTNPNYYYN